MTYGNGLDPNAMPGPMNPGDCDMTRMEIIRPEDCPEAEGYQYGASDCGGGPPPPLPPDDRPERPDYDDQIPRDAPQRAPALPVHAARAAPVQPLLPPGLLTRLWPTLLGGMVQGVVWKSSLNTLKTTDRMGHQALAIGIGVASSNYALGALRKIGHQERFQGGVGMAVGTFIGVMVAGMIIGSKGAS